MDSLTIFLIAIALAIDAFAVALATGTSLPVVSLRHTFRLAWHFGLFQAGMTLLGWACGFTFRVMIEQVDHWLAFALLLFVGGRMIFEAMKDEEEKAEAIDPTRGRTLVILSVATSIDALAVGLSFSLLDMSIWMPALVIGIVATVLTTVGLHLGRFIGTKSRLGERSEIVAGLVLIGIGIRILHEHGVF